MKRTSEKGGRADAEDGSELLVKMAKYKHQSSHSRMKWSRAVLLE